MKNIRHTKFGIRSVAGLLILTLVVISCSRNQPENKTAEKEPIPDSVYMKKGNEIVALTFDTLRNSLLNAISTQGIEGAISFCNEKAYPLTNIYADSITIRRTALRYRNPENKPDSVERTVLDELNAAILSAGKPSPKIIRNSTTHEIHFFRPIILQPMCLNCHGEPGKQIQPATLARIGQLYPEDQAVNFKEGDLRGVWHIVFKSQQE